ncbi:MAG: hypothetical protein K0S09_11 [Sphingobacteriaceae bacterium]|nr:hypothetical protein [Sphingobacteriaceae bacterium]
MDRTGFPIAKKFSIQQLIDLVNQNVVKQQLYTGSANPDNAVGNDGDTYYKHVAGTSFGVWYKVSGAWGELFTISLGGVAPLQYDQTDIANPSDPFDDRYIAIALPEPSTFTMWLTPTTGDRYLFTPVLYEVSGQKRLKGFPDEDFTLDIYYNA